MASPDQPPASRLRDPDATSSYSALLRVPGYARLLVGTVAARTANAALAVSLVLFVLGRYHSAVLAGLASFLAILPGVLLSPLAGALLDRYGRTRLVILDQLMAMAALLVVVVLAQSGRLPAALLLLIVAVQSLTNPLSQSGTRSLLPLLVPRRLWERANAFDSVAYVVAMAIGPPLAGLAVALKGAEAGLALTAGLFALAAGVLLKMPAVAGRAAGGSLLRSALEGLVYVLRNPWLRGLAVTLSVFNLAGGLMNIALPVLVLSRLHESATVVGLVVGMVGIGGSLGAVAAGRINSEGRERRLIVWATLAGAAAILPLVFANQLWLVLLCVFAFGLTNGPYDVGLFTLRQRVIETSWLGRAFAVSAALNFTGVPFGAALGGPLVAHSIALAFATMVAIMLAAAVLPLLTIPDPKAGIRPGPPAVIAS